MCHEDILEIVYCSLRGFFLLVLKEFRNGIIEKLNRVVFLAFSIAGKLPSRGSKSPDYCRAVNC